MDIIICNKGQEYVRLTDLKDWSRLYGYLLQNGYKNPHCLTESVMPKLSIVCIDKTQKFFGSVNVTVMSCLASQGKNVISISEFLD